MFVPKKIISLLVIGSVAFAQLAISYPEAASAWDSSRLASFSSYRTAVEVSEAGWNKSDSVILVRGDDYADALCAGPLAKKHNAPILFTEQHRLNPYTLEEIERLEASKVIIIGGYGAISRNIDKTLDSEGIDEIERIYGDDRYETSVKIAQRLGGEEAALAIGTEYADALSISSIAAAKNFAILLTRPNDLPDIVSQHLNNYKIERTYLIGGEAVISKDVEDQVPSPLRLAGDNRYQTNLFILDYFAEDMDFNTVFAAPGEGKGNYIYALAAVPLAGRTSSPIILNSSILPEETREFLSNNMTVASKLIALGGDNVVSWDVMEQYEQSYKQVLKSVYDQRGVYGLSTETTTIAGNLAIENDDILVQNTLIEGDLLLGSGIGSGTVELRNVTVKGTATIRGGKNSEIIGDQFVSESVIIDTNKTNLTLLGKSTIGLVEIHADADLDDSDSTANGFTDIDIIGGNEVNLRGAYNTVDFAGQGAELALRSSASIKTFDGNAGGEIWGTGSIGTANINSDGLEIGLIPSTTKVAQGIRTYIEGKRVSEGSYTSAAIMELLADPIEDLEATAGDEEVSFTFSRPRSATRVLLMQSTDGGDTWNPASTAGSLDDRSDSAIATGLTNDVEYCFQLVVTGGTRAGESNKVYEIPAAQ